MELANIEELVEKYLDATTTLQEEATLKKYFTGDNVAIHLQEYTSLFNYFAIAKEEQFKKTINLATKKSKKRNSPWFSAAAAVALLVGLFFGKQQYDENEQRKEAQRIYVQVSKGLTLLSSNLKKGEQAVAVLYAYENTINKKLK
ncbi:MAG: flagellar motility protein MotE (MotC chaperone) [Urechidicola sp.]|jgi:flagellar motility protein MotE (MotC chaperone)|tara:strand:- start:187 stop:621 length:435 start_codon:yes stop_codon:yes gene_type:complete